MLHSPQISRHHASLILILLSLGLWATRFHHFGPLPDASWAIFFVGGWLLARRLRWAFAGLLVQAVAIDWIATSHMGVSDYCLSPAYAFILPGYFALWAGGAGLKRLADGRGRDWLWLAVLLPASVTLAFLITDGSFYWLSGQVKEQSLAHYLANAARWYPGFLQTTALYALPVFAGLAGWRTLARRGETGAENRIQDGEIHR